MYAVRNSAMCTKDCLCLFVCPTGATDTENGKIDKDLCLDGCRLCVDACPSKAIYLVYESYPRIKERSPELVEPLLATGKSLYRQELIARSLAAHAPTPEARRLAAALERSSRILAEDCARESGYLHPFGPKTLELLNEMLEALQSEPDEEQQRLITELLALLQR